MNDPLGLFDKSNGSDPLGLFEVEDTSDYGKYVKAYKESQSKPQIPNSPTGYQPTEKLLSEEEWKKRELSKNPTVLNILRSGVEQGLNLFGGAGAQLVAPIGAALSKLNNPSGVNLGKSYENIVNAGSSLGTNLLNATGQNTEFTEDVGQKVANIMQSAPGLAAHVPTAGGLLPGVQAAVKGGLPKRAPKVSEEKAYEQRVADINEKINKANAPKPASDFEATAQRQAKYNQADAEQVARLEAYFNRQNEPQAPISVDKAGTAYTEPYNAVRQALEAQKEHELSVQQLQDLNNRGQQMSIVEDFGSNDPVASMPHMRVDENGMPIRADLSMEAQNLQDPLQRHLWGDEMPYETGDGGIPLTQALDSMEPGPARDAAIKQLSGEVKSDFSLPETPSSGTGSPSLNRGIGGNQRGAVDFNEITKHFPRFANSMFRDTLFHGTTNDIKGGFKASPDGALGPGVYLAADPALASSYGEKGSVHQVYANIERPLIVQGDFVDNKALARAIVSDPKIADNFWSAGQAKRWADRQVEDFAGIGDEEFPQMLKDAGYDAVIHVKADGTVVEINVPDSRNVVSAISPKETFNSGMSRGQRGALNFGKPSSSNLEGKAIEKQDTLQDPISPELIAKKDSLAKKAIAASIDTPYNRVSTLEEAIAGISKEADMSRVGATSLRSGSEGALRTNVRNKVLNFIRNKTQEASNKAETLSKEYLTNPKTGLVSMYKKLSDEDKIHLAAVLKELDRKQIPLTEALMDAVDLNPNQKLFANRLREALDTAYAEQVKALGEQGFESMFYRKGYMPSMWSGDYSSAVGFYDKTDGRFVVTGWAQADTAWGHKQALKKYAEMGEKYAVALPVQRKSLSTRVGQSNVYNGLNDLIARMAELDPKFAEAKAAVDQHTADAVRSLFRFDVHEIKKAGVRGSLGDRPWLDAKTNAKELFEGMANYLEQSFEYSSLQPALNDFGKLSADPKFATEMPNTKKFLDKHVNKLTGQDLNVAGAFGNAAIDKTIQVLSLNQLGPTFPRKLVNAVQTASTSMMMGFGNMGFAAMQLSQLPLSGVPELMAIRETLGISRNDMAHSFATSPIYLSVLSAAEQFKKPEWAKSVPQHMQEAYVWAHQVGMFDYSEAELVHQLNKSDVAVKANKVINAPIIYSEKLTRPPMFFAAVDMFYKAGFKGEDALLRAQAATNYAMTNYHPSERPGVYSSLGEVGKLVGSLSVYKHNFIEQGTSRILNAKQQPEAFLAAFAIAASFYGVAGLPGYQEINKLVEGTTGKNIRQYLFSNAKEPSKIMDGLASYYSGIDIQSRVAMSSVLPDPTHPLGAAPHINNAWNIFSSGVEYAMKQDDASLRAMLQKSLPASARNIYETQVLTDEQGWVRDAKGNKTVEQPRTPEESHTRAKWGLRPLRERLDSENLWSQSKAAKANEDKLKALEKDFDNAVRLGSPNKSIVDKYVELGGDRDSLLNRIDRVQREKSMTPEQRARGLPNDSLKSIRRNNYYDNN